MSPPLNISSLLSFQSLLNYQNYWGYGDQTVTKTISQWYVMAM